jgi:hypothetical protein
MVARVVAAATAVRAVVTARPLGLARVETAAQAALAGPVGLACSAVPVVQVAMAALAAPSRRGTPTPLMAVTAAPQGPVASGATARVRPPLQAVQQALAEQARRAWVAQMA